MVAAAAVFDVPLPAEACCIAHAPHACPEHYRQELEPADETIAELQSIVVAMRHRRECTGVAELEDAMRLQTQLVVASITAVDRIRHSMALAAIAIRYREEIPLP